MNEFLQAEKKYAKRKNKIKQLINAENIYIFIDKMIGLRR